MYEIKAYHCDYCKRYYTSKGNAKRHEKICFKNPDNKCCLSCNNYVWDINQSEYLCLFHQKELVHVCEEETSYQIPYQHNCEHWNDIVEVEANLYEDW